MLDFSAHDDFRCELLLNGVPIQSLRVRQIGDSVDDFDLVVTDSVLGAFSLHSMFEIELHQADSSWRRVSLDELKGIVKDKQSVLADDLAKASETAECRLFARLHDIVFPHWGSGRFPTLGREEACVRYVQRIFYRVGIPHLVAGTTFTVPSASTAQIPLKRAGFRRSTISASALVEPRTRVTVQLIERDPDR
jgi:hypothetical protein